MARGPRRSGREGREVYRAITDRIIAALERGTVPWRTPWSSHGKDGHRNALSGRPSRGINLRRCARGSLLPRRFPKQPGRHEPQRGEEPSQH